jgi:hypothetical protein
MAETQTDFPEKLAALHAEGLTFTDCVKFFAGLDTSARAAALRKAAFEQHHEEGEVEIDDICIVSGGDNPDGAYVMAWVWAALDDNEVLTADDEPAGTDDEPKEEENAA